MIRPDLTERLLRLGEGERGLLLDLYQARFAAAGHVDGLAELSGGAPQRLEECGLLRRVATDGGEVAYLSQTGVRAALALLGTAERSGGRAYAALRLRHELRRTDLYVALRRAGMPAEAYAAEPRLVYRSAAGLGDRALVPDALVRRQPGDALIEVDLGTEGGRQLRHKWLRYREWREESPGRDLFVLAADPAEVLRTLYEAHLAAEVGDQPSALARAIMAGAAAEGLLRRP